MVKKSVILCVVVFVLAGSTAFAFIIDSPPPWRGEEGSTCQGWSFDTDSTYPSPDLLPPGCSGNPYGDPELRVQAAEGYAWYDTVYGRQGVWPLSGEIDVYLPNWPQPQIEKRIWLQLVWKPAELCGLLPDEPLISVTPFETLTMSRVADEDMGEGWWHTVWDISLSPNPPGEWISIKGDILVDMLTIDTICIPEPATILLFSLGGLVLLGSRRYR